MSTPQAETEYKSTRIVMLDIETLGVRAASSQILSIGAVDNFGAEFYHNISYKGNKQFWATRLTTEPETLNWWLNTAPLAAIKSVRDPKHLYDVEDALVSFARYLQGADEIWCNGASFDFPKLDWHYAQLNLATPWSYKALRCYRTFLGGLPTKPPKNKTCTHNALQDAKDQLETLLDWKGK